MKAIVVVLLIACSTIHAAAKPFGHMPANRAGFDLGYGFQNGLQVNYVHEVYFLQFKYLSTIWQKHSLTLDIAALPQCNLTRYKITNNSLIHERGWEFGLHAALIGRYFLRDDRSSVFLLLGIGPHYVIGVPARQTPGFLFSDNIMAGIDLQLTPKIIFSLTGGFRHISNASIKQPNGGINNLMVFGGLTFSVNKKQRTVNREQE